MLTLASLADAAELRLSCGELSCGASGGCVEAGQRELEQLRACVETNPILLSQIAAEAEISLDQDCQPYATESATEERPDDRPWLEAAKAALVSYARRQPAQDGTDVTLSHTFSSYFLYLSDSKCSSWA